MRYGLILYVCVCVCVGMSVWLSEGEFWRGGAYDMRGCVGIVCVGCMYRSGVCVCVCGWVEVVFVGQANILWDSLRVGSESKIIVAIKNKSYIHHEKDM